VAQGWGDNRAHHHKDAARNPNNTITIGALIHVKTLIDEEEFFRPTSGRN
jgi:hypothetical protein